MRWIAPVSASIILAVLAGAAFAGAQEVTIPRPVRSIEVKRNVQDTNTTFGLGCDGEPCGGFLTVRRGKRTLFSEEIFGDEESSYDGIAVFEWSCRRTGRLTWTIEYDDDVKSRTGRFTLGRCGKKLPRPVRRSGIAELAAERFDDEFVSRSRCAALNPKRDGKASKWRCSVTHNSTIRICDATVDLAFTRQRKFGFTDYSRTTRVRKSSCRSF